MLVIPIYSSSFVLNFSEAECDRSIIQYLLTVSFCPTRHAVLSRGSDCFFIGDRKIISPPTILLYGLLVPPPSDVKGLLSSVAVVLLLQIPFLSLLLLLLLIWKLFLCLSYILSFILTAENYRQEASPSIQEFFTLFHCLSLSVR